MLAGHQLLAGETILKDLERILADKLCMQEADVRKVVGFVRDHAEVVMTPAPAERLGGDPDDRWLVAAALAGSADAVVTGDKDLLDAGPAEGLRIVSPRGMWELLRAR